MLVRQNRKRKIVNEELDTCRCLPDNLKWIISNRETLIEPLSHFIKESRVSRRRGVGIGCDSNSPLRLTEAVRERGREQLASLSTAAMMSGRVAVMMNESFGRVGKVQGAKK